MAVNDIYQLTVRQQLHGQTVLNVLHYRCTVAPSSGTFEDSLINAFGTNVLPSWKSCQSDELTHTGLVAQKIFPLPPTVAIVSTAYIGSGALTDNALPTSIAAVITKRTAFAGRKWRGRVFLAGVGDDQEVDSLWQASGMTLFNTLAALLDSNIAHTAGNWVPVLYHRSTNTATDITVCTASSVIRNQRRRQVGRGV